MTEPRVEMRHVRQARLCAAGARAFCARYDLDWTAFRRDGLPVSLVEATGDALVERVCVIAREEVDGGR